MKRSLIFVTVIGLLFVSTVFGQKTKKTNPNPNSQAGSEAATTNNTSQAATKAQSEQMKVRDKNSWYNTKVYVEIALSYLANPANGFADDSNFHSLKQNTQDAHALLICHETGVNPCNNSGEAQNLRKGNIEAVKNSLKNAKSDLSRNAFSSSEKTAVMAKLNKALELADIYINAHTYTAQSQKGKGVGADDLVKSNPPIDESTKTQNGQNPIANGTSTSSSSNSTQKTTNPNSGFMDQPDDAAKATPKNAQKTNNLGGDNDPEKTQRSTKTNKSKAKTTSGYRDTDEDVEDVKAKNKTVQPKTNNLSGDDDLEATQRSTKNNKSKQKNIVFDAGDGVRDVGDDANKKTSKPNSTGQAQNTNNSARSRKKPTTKKTTTPPKKP